VSRRRGAWRSSVRVSAARPGRRMRVSAGRLCLSELMPASDRACVEGVASIGRHVCYRNHVAQWEFCGGASLERCIAPHPPAVFDAVDKHVVVAVSGVRSHRSWRKKFCGILELRKR
jgi:hypothetical protein